MKFILLIILLFVFTSCNNNSNNPVESNKKDNVPNNYTITVTTYLNTDVKEYSCNGTLYIPKMDLLHLITNECGISIVNISNYDSVKTELK